jgi:integrase
VLDVGRDEDGKRKQKWLSGFKTKREAQAALAGHLTDLQKGVYVEPTRETVGEYLAEWLDSIRATVRPTTMASYRGLMTGHVIPRIGAVPLRQLGPAQLQRLYVDVAECGRLRGRGSSLSPRTVQYIHVVIHRAMRDAVRWGKIQRNPTDLVDPPRLERTEMQVWAPEQLGAFLRFVSKDRLAALWQLAATTGMRRGELLGPRWTDVDFEASRLAIRQTLVDVGCTPTFSEPKTAKSRRSIAIDGGTLAVLRQHRARQAAERLAWGPSWEDIGLVFTREDGTLINPQTLSAAFKRHVKAAGLPTIRLHDLRHSYATAALSAGIHAKVVSDRLGHSSVGITLDVYSHVVPALQEEAAETIAALIVGQ